MTKSPKLLFVDDSEDDVLLILRHLRQGGLSPAIQRVDTISALRSALEAFHWDAVLCDFNMPHLDALGALEQLRAIAGDVPFIVISGAVPEDRLVSLMKAGAQDIVVKGQLSRLVPAIEREIEEAASRRQRKEAEKRLRVAIESISEGFTLYDAQDRLVLCNEVYKKMHGKAADIIIPGTSFEEIVRRGAERGQYEGAAGRTEDFVRERMEAHRTCMGPFEQKLGNGRWIRVDERRTRDGGTVGIRTDITPVKAAEQSLRESEAFLRLIADNLPTLIAYWDPEGRCRFINQTGAQWYARPQDAILDRTRDEILEPEILEALPPFGDLISKDGETRVDLTATFPDGTTRTVHAAYIPDRQPHGEVRGVVSMMVDMTEHVAAARALRASEEQFRGAFEAAPHGIALIGLDWRWLKVSRAVYEMLDYDEQQLLRTTLRSVTHPDDREADAHHIRLMLDGEISNYQIEKRFLRRSGDPVVALLSVSLVRDAHGSPTQFVAQLLDLTERKKIERMKSEFVSTVSHELRTPLTAIKGALGLLKSAALGDLPEQTRSVIEIAHTNSDKLVRLINDILEVEKLEDGRMTFQFDAVDVREFVTQSLQQNRAIADQYGIRMKLEDLDETAHMRADPQRISQVLDNLLFNAAKFSPRDETVTVRARRKGSRVRISVADNGPGIPEHFQDKVFEKFSQADSSDTREKGGTGLGLSISKAIVEAHGGEIGFETAPNEGSEFYIDLPIARLEPSRGDQSEGESGKTGNRAGVP